MAIIKPSTPFDSIKRKSSDTDQSNYTKLQTYTAAFKAQKGKKDGYLYLRDYIVAQEFVKPVFE